MCTKQYICVLYLNFSDGRRFIRELDDSFTWASHADLQLDPSEPAKCSVCEKPTAGRIWFENNTLSIDGVALHRGDFVVTQPMNTSPWFAPGTYDVLQNRNSTPGQVFQVLSVLRSEEHGRDYLVAVALQPLERVNTLQAQGLVGPDHSSCPGRAEQDEVSFYYLLLTCLLTSCRNDCV